MSITKFIEIHDYSTLNKYMAAFSLKHMGLLIIVSRAGLGKSYLVEQNLEVEAPLLLNSHVTPLRFYQLLYERTQEEKDCLLIIDEAEMMFQNPKLKTMLKITCDTRDEKIIKYDSTSPLLAGVPKEFSTEVKTVLLLNTLNPSDEHIKAIMSRGHLVYFNPPDVEILNYLKGWGEDKEVIKFIGDFASHSKSLNLRTYVKAVESKKAGLNWEQEVINELDLDNRFLVIRSLIKNYKTDKERIIGWTKITRESRANYFRWKKLYDNKNKRGN